MPTYTVSYPFAEEGPSDLTAEQLEEAKELFKAYEEGGKEYKDLKLTKDTYSQSEVKALIAIAEKKPAPNPLLPETSEIVWGSIAFFVVFGFLAKFALPAAKKAMAARTAKIEGDLAAAAAAKADAEKEAATYRAQIGDAKGEGSKIVDDARAQAETVRKDIIARAEAEAADIKAKAVFDADAQADRVKVELQSHVRGLSIDLAEKVVGQNLDRSTNEALVDRYIAELAR
jgi:F-type H+-transporting ATPase subunit b